MKKKILPVILTVLLSSCASIVQKGKANSYQKTKPVAGQPSREIKVFPFVMDIIFFGVPLAVDYATFKIYKEQPSQN